MFSFFYNVALFLFVLASLPKILWQRVVLKKYRREILSRFRLNTSYRPSSGKKVIWIHAVSMGETRAVIPFFKLLKERHPEADIVISSTTETGHEEAKKSMPNAQAHFFLPLDFSWIMKRAIEQIRPNALFLCEGDFWYHLLLEAKRSKASIFVINGKISERSCKRFSTLSFFSKRLFSLIDYFCVQSERFKKRFVNMGIDPQKITVTGNLKWDVPSQVLSSSDLQQWKDKLGIKPQDRILTIGSTHAPEEAWLFQALSPLWEKIPHFKVLIAPRHPERFAEVKAELEKRKIPFLTHSQLASCSQEFPEPQVILIDAMGVLNLCYQCAEVAIVAGSFVSHVGGHNILEPVLLGVPVLFGPYMHSQKDLEEVVIEAQAGKRVLLEGLSQTLFELFENDRERKKIASHCRSLQKQMQGSAKRSYEAIHPIVL